MKISERSVISANALPISVDHLSLQSPRDQASPSAGGHCMRLEVVKGLFMGQIRRGSKLSEATDCLL